MHALDERIDRQDLDPIALGLDDRRVITDAHQHPAGRRRQRALDAGDELTLSQVCNGGWWLVAGRPPYFA